MRYPLNPCDVCGHAKKFHRQSCMIPNCECRVFHARYKKQVFTYQRHLNPAKYRLGRIRSKKEVEGVSYD